MRALILIVSCVIVLAIVQASYLVVDAHTSGPIIRVSDDAHQVAHRSHPHHKAQAQALKDTREHAKVTRGPPATTRPLTAAIVTTGPSPSPLNHDGEQNFRLRMLCERRPELSRCRTEYVVKGSAGTGTTRNQDSAVTKVKTEMKPETNPALPPSDVSVNETIRQILELAMDRKSPNPTSSLYGQGAHHKNINTTTAETTTDTPPAKNFIMELTRAEERREEMSLPEVSIRRGHHKELGYHNYANRNIRLHRQGCSLDRDCGTGCCLESKTGRRTCRRGGLRGSGKRCTSSCMCIPELQCWVSDNSPRHKLRKARKLWGRCQHPGNRNLGAGHFLTAPSGQRTY